MSPPVPKYKQGWYALRLYRLVVQLRVDIFYAAIAEANGSDFLILKMLQNI